MTRILTLDIETSPSLAHVWALWKQDISPTMLAEIGGVIAFAAKWHDKREVSFYSDFHDGHEAMIAKAHEMIDEADVVVHYNGSAFDMKHLNREFLLAGLAPPSPVQEIDLFKVVKQRFRFLSNRLNSVVKELGIGEKVSHTGFDLWKRCMAGDEKAWDLMRRYNKQDVVITERLYMRLRPWVKTHPHVAITAGPDAQQCGRCGSTKLQRRGTATTSLGVFQRYQCQSCGGWSRGGKSVARADVRPL